MLFCLIAGSLLAAFIIFTIPNAMIAINVPVAVYIGVSIVSDIGFALFRRVKTGCWIDRVDVHGAEYLCVKYGQSILLREARIPVSESAV